MPSQSIRNRSILAATAVVAFLGLAPSVQADMLTVTAAEDGGSAMTIISASGSGSSGLTGPLGLSGSFSGLVGPDFALSVQGATAQQTAGGFSLETGSASSVFLVAGSSGVHTLHLVLTATGYTAPLSGKIDSLISGTVPVAGASNVLTYASTVGTTTVTNTPPSIVGTGSFLSDATGSVASLATGYSIVETINITLTAGSVLNYSSSTTISALATPEPATVAMAMTALPILGLGGWLGRRRGRA
jgi:hypothetical protein